MSSTRDLQNFIQINKVRRGGSQSPQERADEAAKQKQDKGEDIADMAAKNIKAVKDAQSDAKVEAAREGMAEVMGDQLREKKVLPKRTGEVAMMKEGGGGAGGAGGLAGGGTVAVASDPGVFTNTFGGGAKKRMGIQSSNKKKDKKDKTVTSGVTKADRFLRGEEVNQSRKSVQDFAKWVVNEARVSMIQLDAKPENVNTNDINEPPAITSTKSGPPRNPHGRRGKQGLSPGQQGYSRDQYDHHFNFTKMETVTEVLKSNPSVLSLLKALDTDVPIGVH